MDELKRHFPLFAEIMQWWTDEHGFEYKEKIAPQGYWMPLIHMGDVPKDLVFYCEIYDKKGRCINRSIYPLSANEKTPSIELRNAARKELIKTTLLSGINSMAEITDQLYREGRLP